MDKKFIAAVVVCFVALTGVATGTYFLGQKTDENIVNLKEANSTATTANEDNIQAAQNKINAMIGEATGEENTVALDREDFGLVGYQGETTATNGNNYNDDKKGTNKNMKNIYDDDKKANNSVGDNEKSAKTSNAVEKNTVSNVKADEYLYGLSSEAAAQIKALKFNKSSEIQWPVQGSVIMPYDMQNTVYYATLDQYKCNPGIVIQSKEGTAIKAAVDGVITEIVEDDELGLCINQAIGSDYVATYGQIINPKVKAGDFVKTGDTIAYVNKPTRYYTKEGDNVFFAIKKDGKAVNPLDYINYED